ncbi:MAG TPA: dihydrofolate reductase family protein [Polyangia bacterium]|nr:dihydrofolate reductase family protein [Polyangia bacterium]
MARVVYMQSVSLDGFVETPDHEIDWTAPSPELERVLLEDVKNVSVFLHGRRTYDLMASVWPTADASPGASPFVAAFAPVWRDTPKVVFSRSARDVAWNSRLVTTDAARAVAALKAEHGGEMWLGGPDLAATFVPLGLIDEYRVNLRPFVLGAGTPYLPAMDRRVALRLIEPPRTFPDGGVMLRYAPLDA